MYMTPQQRIGNAMSENRFAYNAAVGKAQSDAAINPFNRAMNFVGGAAGMYLGNNGFGGGGQQQSGGFFQKMRSGIGSLFGNTSSAPTSPNQSGGYYNAPRPLT